MPLAPVCYEGEYVSIVHVICICIHFWSYIRGRDTYLLLFAQLWLFGTKKSWTGVCISLLVVYLTCSCLLMRISGLGNAYFTWFLHLLLLILNFLPRCGFECFLECPSNALGRCGTLSRFTCHMIPSGIIIGPTWNNLLGIYKMP